MMSLFFRNLLFTILKPGMIAGFMPYLILGKVIEKTTPPWTFIQYIAFIVFIVGFIMLFWCIRDFAVKGRGTLSPIDPTQKLVISGLYRYSRNPMYNGVMLMLLGEILFYNSAQLLLYSLLIFCIFNLFIIFREEPRLRQDFGAAYTEYCKKVRRWI